MSPISLVVYYQTFFFQDGRRFYDLFKICISRLSELEESLRKRYDLKEVEKAYRAKDMQLSETATNGVDKGNSQIEFGERLIFYVLHRLFLNRIQMREKLQPLD